MKRIHIVKKMIIDARKAAGLSQKELGERLGMSQPSYAYYETGTGTIPNTKLMQIVETLGQPSEPFLEAAASDRTVSKSPTTKRRKSQSDPKNDRDKTVISPRKKRSTAISRQLPAGLRKQLEQINNSLGRIADHLEAKS